MGAFEPRLTRLSQEIRVAERTIGNLRRGINRRRTELSALAQQPFMLGGCSMRIQVGAGTRVEVYVNGTVIAERNVVDRSDARGLAEDTLRSSCHATDSVTMEDVVSRIRNATGAPS